MTSRLSRFFAASDQKGSLGMKFRDKRFRFFENAFKENFEGKSPIKILDVGGTEAFWKGKKFIETGDVEIIFLNLKEEPVTQPNITSMAGDATNLSQFGDQSIDLVFSNSVIEHLYTWQNQVKMALEIQRVGKKHFVQTPNKFFFIEPHYAVPFFQFIPKSIRYFLLTKTKISRLQKWESQRAKQYIDEIRLLSHNEVQKLFPSSKIYLEKLMGMNKSFTAHNL
ncbi:class I SAM-dependent methyltransferase [Echinicola jeungdonensis]|uniref:Methyltransferase domain-containing protein n=1 Tax=Echinicola jeungdonensis TaxID=709343 RepID=A0ABV5J6L0_9BACT|nr:class I SAM-dependent methyltransferase [Echinicola jeungdonensis]MDN3669280.1 class I SAM-dependent methyltransferase [Echinicola jeungdonensis]